MTNRSNDNAKPKAVLTQMITHLKFNVEPYTLLNPWLKIIKPVTKRILITIDPDLGLDLDLDLD